MTRLRPASILVAEDNSTNQIIITAHLHALGMTFKVVKNGIEVLKSLSEENFELILMDCLMPEMDGFEATLFRIRHEVDNTDMASAA